jgi:hypothetical protein
MVAILIGYILFNALRATRDPGGFAAYYGLPAVQPGSEAFAFVYAVRALFLGAFGLALLLARAYRGLALFAVVGAIMPLGDAALVAYYAGGSGIIVRHVATAIFLLITGALVWRWAARSQQLS